jgi:hypothetical protein
MADEKPGVKNYVQYTMIKNVYLKLLKQELITQAEFDRALEYAYDKYKIAEAEKVLSDSKFHKEKKEYHSKPVPQTSERQDDDYVSLTDTVRQYNESNPGYTIQSWLRNDKTIEFLNLWEHENNPDYNTQGYNDLKEKMRSGSFTMTPKQWIGQTGAIGLKSRQGKKGGTYAHPIIACEFLTWLSPEFKLRVIEMRRAIGRQL